MNRDELVAALSGPVPPALAKDLVDTFLEVRRDVVGQRLGGSAAGKFVETIVQVMQHLHAGAYDASPAVDPFLKAIESQSSPMPDGLRICGARMARTMYTLRSKRNVVHKGDVDSNTYDQAFLHHGAQWLLAELLRTVSGLPMQEAGKLVAIVQAPAGGLVEDYGGKKLVMETMTSREEALVLLQSHHPQPVTLQRMYGWMDRFKRPTVRIATRTLWQEKVVEGTAKDGYTLTSKGLAEAHDIVSRYV